VSLAIRTGWLLVVVLLWWSENARAQIYKCPGGAGEMIFTSDPTACPGAQPHALRRDLQRAVQEPAAPSRSSGARRQPGVGRTGSAEDGFERMWRRKRPESVQELKQLDARLARMKGVVQACNEGSQWYATDASGIRKHVPCSELRAQHAELENRRRQLVAYLEEGLEDACRRAGCRPGWVR